MIWHKFDGMLDFLTIGAVRTLKQAHCKPKLNIVDIQGDLVSTRQAQSFAIYTISLFDFLALVNERR